MSSARVILIPGTTDPNGLVKKSDLEPIGVAAGRFGSISGGANLGAIAGQANAFMLDSAATEKIGTRLLLPSFWATFQIVLSVANTTTAAGDAVLFGQLNFTGADGDDISANKVTWLSNGAAVVIPTTVGTEHPVAGNSGLAAVPGKWLNLSLQRAGGSLPNDLAILGVKLIPQTIL